MIIKDRRLAISTKQNSLVKLQKIAAEDQSMIMVLKKQITSDPIKPTEFLEYTSIDPHPGIDEEMFSDFSKESYAAILFIREHKKRVDKLIRKTKKELKDLQRT